MTLKLMKACFSCLGFLVLATIILKDETVCNLGTTLTSTPKQISSATKPATLYLKGKSMLVFGKNFRAYIFSALKHSAQTFTAFSGRKGQHIQNMSEHIVIMGWILKGNILFSELQLFCCFYHVDGSISTVKADIRVTHFESNLSIFNALQCVCKVHSAVSPVIKVSIKESDSACPNTVTHYVHVDAIQQRQIDGIALCAKVLYDKLNASILIEWFEAQRWLGVDKIFCYINKDLNNDAKNVIKYYEETGLTKAASFEVPEIDTFPRHLADKDRISWTDAGVPLLDCQERMHEYKYAICLDHDEILIPENITLKDSLKRYLVITIEPIRFLLNGVKYPGFVSRK
ncbi:uncharacterized protein LOC123555313 [Mercenaria mercenaria]|uniref:uncharacterized protein LOC123555313 n=1 Tax=Mercenaria mercenaria TaxID=6596 RepID=UPI00234E5A43|nr:uncharacterized protein LOC123555313 [Mercenaria mercenaria]